MDDKKLIMLFFPAGTEVRSNFISLYYGLERTKVQPLYLINKFFLFFVKKSYIFAKIQLQW